MSSSNIISMSTFLAGNLRSVNERTLTVNLSLILVITQSFNCFLRWKCAWCILFNMWCLFMQKNSGLLALIDEESKFSRATDQTLATKLHGTHGKDLRNIYMAPRDGGTSFNVVHYAGCVSDFCLCSVFICVCVCVCV